MMRALLVLGFVGGCGDSLCVTFCTHSCEVPVSRFSSANCDALTGCMTTDGYLCTCDLFGDIQCCYGGDKNWCHMIYPDMASKLPNDLSSVIVDGGTD